MWPTAPPLLVPYVLRLARADLPGSKRVGGSRRGRHFVWALRLGKGYHTTTAARYCHGQLGAAEPMESQLPVRYLVLNLRLFVLCLHDFSWRPIYSIRTIQHWAALRNLNAADGERRHSCNCT
jgi:hypothetical protein